MKFLILSDGIAPFSLGGIQRHTQLLVRYLLLAKHDVVLYYTAEKALSDKDLLQACIPESDLGEIGDFRTKYFEFPKPLPLPGHYLRASRAFSKALFEAYQIEEEKFDLIYAQGFCSWYFAEHHKEVKHPVAVNFHGFEMYQRPAGKWGRTKNYMLRAPVKAHLGTNFYWLSLGPGISKIIRSLGVDEKMIIENPSGIEKDWLRSIEEIKANGTVKFLYLGRYERRKGIEEIHEVLKQLPESHFEFIGPIPEKFRIKRDNVIYHGTLQGRERICQVIDGCDVLVAPSYSEGLPNVIMEAMARGLAIITTDVGANGSLANEANALLVEPGSSKSLRETIEQLRSSDALSILDMKRASRRHIESFVWPKPIKELCSVINEVSTPNS